MKQFKQTNNYLHDKVIQHDTELLENEAELALRLIDRWGCVAGVQDGEDSSGRSKFRLQTPHELVDRAFEISKLAFDKARNSGLVITMPGIDELFPDK